MQPPAPQLGPAPGAPNEPRATIALVLGIFALAGMLCWGLGFVLGIPAVVLGLLARRDIARSSGQLGGGGMAMAGIVCGAIGGVLSAGQIAMVAVMLLVSSSISTPSVPPAVTASPAYGPAVYDAAALFDDAATGPGVSASGDGGAAPPPPSSGGLVVKALAPEDGALKDQLARELAAATAKKQPLVVYTTAAWCAECREVEQAMSAPQVAAVLALAAVARVDIDAFKGQLSDVGMEQPVVPFFFYFDDASGALRPRRTLSANSWAANTPENVGPALERFLAGASKGKPGPPAPPAPSTRGTAL